MGQTHERFTVRVTDEAMEASAFLEEETGLSRSKIVDILLKRAEVEDFDEYLAANQKG